MPKSDYPYLRGDKIGSLWLRMLRDNVGIAELNNIDRIPIPVDINIARATLTTGVVRGEFNRSLYELFKSIREALFESVKGLNVKNRPIIALDLDEPLWHLSKNRCTNSDKRKGSFLCLSECEVKEYCIGGKIKIEKNKVELNT
ncbi:MAG: hypothetical protein ACP5T0_00105 [Verrucomicrobiia bacterium]